MNTIEKGMQSQLLKQNPCFIIAVEELRQDLYKKWVATDFSDNENREELFHLKIALELVVSKLDSYITIAENEQYKNEHPDMDSEG